MTIQFAGTNDGWGEYVLNGTKIKPRNHDLVKVLKGDVEFGDRITNATAYIQNAYSIVISFKGKPNHKIIKSSLQDFEKYFMHGFEREEYHLDAVLHLDTDDYHVHVRIPKLNLKTGTQLQLYMDKNDRRRVNLIRDYIDLKYNLESPQNNRKLIAQRKDVCIQKWREEQRTQPCSFSKKRDREQAKQALHSFIKELHDADVIKSIDDIKSNLEMLELKFVRAGHDFQTDTHYLTFENESGKISLKGDLYNAGFWQYCREDRKKQISTNKQFRGTYSRSQSEYERVQTELKKELDKRYAGVTRRYKTARERADKEFKQLEQESQERGHTEGAASHKRRAAFDEFNQKINHSNVVDSGVGKFSNIQAGAVEQMAYTKPIPTTTKKRKVYGYTNKRTELYKRQAKNLYKDRRINVKRDDRNPFEANSKTRAKRRSFDAYFDESRESLYSKARGIMQRNRDDQAYRERYREAIDKVGARCEIVREQYITFVKSAYGVIRNVKEFTKSRELKVIKEGQINEPIEENKLS